MLCGPPPSDSLGSKGGRIPTAHKSQQLKDYLLF